jgi:hypothetical protein
MSLDSWLKKGSPAKPQDKPPAPSPGGAVSASGATPGSSSEVIDLSGSTASSPQRKRARVDDADERVLGKWGLQAFPPECREPARRIFDHNMRFRLFEGELTSI